MERYCRSKEILLVIKHIVGMAHAGKKVWKQDSKKEHAKSIDELFSLSQGVDRNLARGYNQSRKYIAGLA